jgi:hypothetical protein
VINFNNNFKAAKDGVGLHAPETYASDTVKMVADYLA